MQQVTRFGLTVGLAVLAGCAGRTGINDYVRKSDYLMPYAERLLFESRAPIIVLGRVLDAQDVGDATPSAGDSRVIVQLTRITIDIEQVVKGIPATNPMWFYYFTFSALNRTSLGVPCYLPAVGQRRLFFLTPAGNIYRSVGDLTDYTLPVMTGTHPKDFCRGKTPGCCIANILLVPGTNMDVRFFRAYLTYAHYAAGVLCSKTVARRLMELLERNSDKAIADAAREEVRAGSNPY